MQALRSIPDGDALSYSWNFGDGQSGTGVKASHLYSEGNFSVTLTVNDGNGGSDTAKGSITITKNRNPTARFTVIPPGGKVPLSVAVDASSSSDPDGDNLNFFWDFGDGNNGTGITATHTYTKKWFHFPITLSVSDSYGGTDQSTIPVKVDPSGPPPR